MKKHKIHKARGFVFLFLGCACVGALLGKTSTGLMWGCIVAALFFMLCASWASRCPHCGEYLTFKRDWIGKFCKHCGEMIE
ncbi:hypothetical protein OT109_04305 [Phycisphaeraceae bacterium D3-23]